MKLHIGQRCRDHSYYTQSGIITAYIPVVALGLRRDIKPEDVPCPACLLKRERAARDVLAAALNRLVVALKGIECWSENEDLLKPMEQAEEALGRMT